MFRLVYSKLHKIYKSICKLYTAFAIDKPLNLIALYLILSLCLSVWIFQIKIITNNESLTYVKNSDYLKNAKIISEVFPEDQHTRYFQNQLLDNGYYAEIIVKLKGHVQTYPPNDIYSDYETNNFINATIFKAYNQLYDEILNLTIKNDYSNKNESNQKANYVNYYDLGPRRMNNLAIEGGIIRDLSIQDRLLKHELTFIKNDPGKLIIDSSLGDGTSVNFVFGNLHKETCDDQDCTITHVGQIRNRFDLLSMSEEERYLSIKFLSKFVEHMKSLESDLFDLSFHTSHALEPEIISYSIKDLKWVGVMLGMFWLTFFLLMSLDIDFLSFKTISNAWMKFRKDAKCRQFFKFFLRFWLNGSGFMVMITFIQFVITISSTLGIMSLLDVPINQLLNTIVLVLMINSCHQSLLLYKNFKRVNLTCEEIVNKYSCDYNKFPMESLKKNMEESNEYESEIVLKSTRLIHRIVIPNFFALLTTILTYLMIGLTSAFESIAVYCLYMITCLCLNFFGQIFFYVPCLFLHMKKISKNENSFLCCIYKTRTSRSEFAEASEPQNNHSPIYTKLDLQSTDVCTQESTTVGGSELNDSTNIHKSSFRKLLENWSYYKFHLLYNTKFKFVIFSVFICYFIANAFVCGFKVSIDIPLEDLIPADSYLAKHMKYHLRDFHLGPMIMFNYMKPINMNDTAKFNKIIQFTDEVRRMDGMAQFELNWMKRMKQSVSQFSEFYSDTTEIYKASCQNVHSANFINDFYYEVVNGTNGKEEVIITFNRVYLQIAKFVGSSKELEIMDNIQYLADTKYNFKRDEMIIFSSIYVYLEQLGEILPSTITLAASLLECVFFGSLFLFFDLKSVYLKLIVFISLLVSIFANFYAFEISLNIVTLYQMIMLPAFLIEFLFYTMHLFLYKTSSKKELEVDMSEQSQKPFQANKSGSSSSTNSFEKYEIHQLTSLKPDSLTPKPKSTLTKKEIRFKRIQFTLNRSVNLTSLYLVFISVFSFSFMNLCSTYNFQKLGLFLMITCLNTFVHIQFFFPNLLNLFGTCWVKFKPQSTNLAT